MFCGSLLKTGSRDPRARTTFGQGAGRAFCAEMSNPAAKRYKRRPSYVMLLSLLLVLAAYLDSGFFPDAAYYPAGVLGPVRADALVRAPTLGPNICF